MSGRVVLAAAVGGASGAKAAAAALACAGSDPDSPGLLVEIGGRPPRPTLVASAGARELEERLTIHLPQLRAASRGQTCHLAIADDADACQRLSAALPLVRGAVAVVHLPPARFQAALADPGLLVTGVLLRADLASDRSLTALAARGPIERGLVLRVLKRPLGWVPARRALFGVLPPEAAGGLPSHLWKSLLGSQISAEHPCYDGSDDAEADPARTAQRQRRGDEGARRGRRLHRHPQRNAGR